jgi:hypothetical protein
MNQLHKVAQLLVSSWSLGAVGQREIPTSNGVLDRALKSAYDSEALPAWARQEIHFADSRIGLQCIELPAILDWAQAAELTSAPNPSYRCAELKVTSRVARILLRKLKVSEEDARTLGKLLQESIVKANSDIRELDAVGADIY